MEGSLVGSRVLTDGGPGQRDAELLCLPKAKVDEAVEALMTPISRLGFNPALLKLILSLRLGRLGELLEYNPRLLYRNWRKVCARSKLNKPRRKQAFRAMQMRIRSHRFCFGQAPPPDIQCAFVLANERDPLIFWESGEHKIKIVCHHGRRLTVNFGLYLANPDDPELYRCACSDHSSPTGNHGRRVDGPMRALRQWAGECGGH